MQSLRVDKTQKLVSNLVNGTPTWPLVILLCLGYYLLLMLSYEWVFTEALLRDRYQNIGSTAVIDELVQYHEDKKWLYHLIHQLLIGTKLISITVALYTCSFLYKVPVSLRVIFKHVVITEFVILFYELCKLIYLMEFNEYSTFDEALRFAPFSIAVWFNPQLPFWIWQALGAINLIEMVYYLLLSCMYSVHFQQTFTQSLKKVGIAYAVTFFIWLSLSSSLLFYVETGS